MTKVLAIIATVLCLALPVMAGLFFLSGADESQPDPTTAPAATQPTISAPSISPPEEAVVIISRKIEGMQCDTIKEGRVEIDLSGRITTGNWNGSELYIGGHRAVRVKSDESRAPH